MSQEKPLKNEENYLSARCRFIFGAPGGFFEPLTALQRNDSPLRAPLDAFRQNLSSGLLVGSIPFQLAHSSVMNVRSSQILSAERIRVLKLAKQGSELDQAAETLARSIANARMTKELADQSIIELHARNTLHLLHSLELHDSPEELLRQVLVMSWGAFETLINDLVRLLFNLEPSLVLEVAQVRPYKELLTSRNLLEGLEGARFNLASSMGDFLSNLVSLDSLEKIQTTVGAIFQSPSLEMALKDSRLWLIAQQRHLIVHRRSVIDGKYRERTGDTRDIGERLSFDADYC